MNVRPSQDHWSMNQLANGASNLIGQSMRSLKSTADRSETSQCLLSERQRSSKKKSQWIRHDDYCHHHNYNQGYSVSSLRRAASWPADMLPWTSSDHIVNLQLTPLLSIQRTRSLIATQCKEHVEPMHSWIFVATFTNTIQIWRLTIHKQGSRKQDAEFLKAIRRRLGWMHWNAILQAAI